MSVTNYFANKGLHGDVGRVINAFADPLHEDNKGTVEHQRARRERGDFPWMDDLMDPLNRVPTLVRSVLEHTPMTGPTEPVAVDYPWIGYSIWE